MDRSPNTAPQGNRVASDATNASVHRTSNDLKRKRIPTTPVPAAKDAAHNSRSSKTSKIRDVHLDSNHQLPTDSRISNCKLDRQQSATPPQQELAREVTGEIQSTLPSFSLADRGHLSEQSYIPWYTAEPDHDAALTAIKHEEDGVFTCHINILIEDTAETCTGVCRVPVAEMDSEVTGYYRSRPRQMEDFNIERVSIGTSFETLTGKVCLGSVIGEDYCPGTYTCKAEFGRSGGVKAWAAEVYVPKKCVPDHKLVDYEGENGAIVSTESVSEETKSDEEVAAYCRTVEFSRHIICYQEQMTATFWSRNGDQWDRETQIVAYKVDDQYFDLQFRTRWNQASWWHFNGRMHKYLKHGRFYCSPLPVPNIESDMRFGFWPDREWDAEISR